MASLLWCGMPMFASGPASDAPFIASDRPFLGEIARSNGRSSTGQMQIVNSVPVASKRMILWSGSESRAVPLQICVPPWNLSAASILPPLFIARLVLQISQVPFLNNILHSLSGQLFGRTNTPPYALWLCMLVKRLDIEAHAD